MSSSAHYATPRDPSRRTHGPAVAAVARRLGRPLIPWQLEAIDTALELDPETGRYAYSVVTLSVPRQSGKTVLVMALSVMRALGDRARCWYTADTGEKARDAWREAVEDFPPAFRRPGMVRRSNGSERWSPGTGGFWRPFPPTRDSLHGKQSDLAIVDEAWRHSEATGSELLTAIKPTQQTRRRPQVWIISAAGDPASTWWHGLVDAGRTGPPRHAHFEWRAPSDDAVLDPDTWPEWHPGFGHLFTADAIPDLLSGMAVRDAVRSYGNRPAGATVSKWPPNVWEVDSVVDLEHVPPAGAIAVDVAPDRDSSSIGAAHRLEDGRTLVQLLATGAGTAWLGPMLLDLGRRLGRIPLAYDLKAQAADVVAGLGRLPFRLEGLDTPGYARACSGMFEAVVDGRAVRLAAPELDAAGPGAVPRPMLDVWAWSRARSSADVTPLVAVSEAWHVLNRPTGPAPKVRARHAT